MLQRLRQYNPQVLHCAKIRLPVRYLSAGSGPHFPGKRRSKACRSALPGPARSRQIGPFLLPCSPHGIRRSCKRQLGFRVASRSRNGQDCRYPVVTYVNPPRISCAFSFVLCAPPTSCRMGPLPLLTAVLAPSVAVLPDIVADGFTFCQPLTDRTDRFSSNSQVFCFARSD